MRARADAPPAAVRNRVERRFARPGGRADGEARAPWGGAPAADPPRGRAAPLGAPGPSRTWDISQILPRLQVCEQSRLGFW